MIHLVCPIDRLPLDDNLRCGKGHSYSRRDGTIDFIIGDVKDNDLLDKVAPLYEDIWAPLGFVITARTTYSSVLKEAALFTSGDQFLDVGTGPGKIFDYVRCNECYGLDISFKFLKILRRKRPSVVGVRADARSLPFPDEVFSGVSSMFVLHMLDDPGKAISEISRVMKGDGKCALGLLTKSGFLSNLLSRWWKIDLKTGVFYTGLLEREGLEIVRTKRHGIWSIIMCRKVKA
ncbi:MAG: class I SAM-dependent methyltransferase [Metallosphaera sp.]